MAAEPGVKKQKKASATKPDAGTSKEAKRKRDPDTEATHTDDTAKQPGASAPAAADTADAGPGGRPRKKARQHKRAAEQEQLDPAEAARRQRQRELRERATKLRAEGKEYVPPRKGGKAPKEGQQGKGTKGKDGDHKGRHYLGDKQPGWRPFSSVEVIVLPIFWNNNKEEKSAVLAAAERARDILASAGLSADMDASNKYTPGQKMKYWETMGVRVRVEVGPRDVANGNCVVALSTKAPGEVATKNVVNMRHKMLDAVRTALQNARSARLEQQEGQDGGKEDGGAAGAQPQAAAKGNGSKAALQQGPQDGSEEEQGDSEDGRREVGGGEDSEGEEEEDEQGAVAAALAKAKSRQGGVLQKSANPEGRKLKKQRAGGVAAAEDADASAEPGAAGKAAAAQGRQAAMPKSADALEDDFGDIVEFEPEEDKLTLSKKERLKKAVKQTKAKRRAERLAGRRSEEPDEASGGEEPAGWTETGPKKAKVVTF